MRHSSAACSAGGITNTLLAEMYHADPAGYWNQFYASHQEHFFKNRKWLASEFGELEDAAREGVSAAADLTIIN